MKIFGCMHGSQKHSLIQNVLKAYNVRVIVWRVERCKEKKKPILIPPRSSSGEDRQQTQLKSSKALSRISLWHWWGVLQKYRGRTVISPVILRFLIDHISSPVMQRQCNLFYMSPCMHVLRNKHPDTSSGEQWVPQLQVCSIQMTKHCWVPMDE